jgi:hypothetical protein
MDYEWGVRTSLPGVFHRILLKFQLIRSMYLLRTSFYTSRQALGRRSVLKTTLLPKQKSLETATIVQYRPGCGGMPEAMAKALPNGRATSPTVIPARRSAMNRRVVYSLRQRTDFGNQAPIILVPSGTFDFRTAIVR